MDSINYVPNGQFTAASILLTENCNLNCKYCYQHDNRKNINMSEEMCEKIVDFLIEGVLAQRKKAQDANPDTKITLDENGRQYCPCISNSNAHVPNSINMTFFGGEPTLNIPGMRRLLEYSLIKTRKHNIQPSFTLITNSLKWSDELEEFLQYWWDTLGHMNVQLSIDGIPEVLNTNRQGINPNDDVASRIEATAKKYVEWFAARPEIPAGSLHAHACLSKYSLPFASESYHYIKDVIGIPHIWFMPVHEEPWDEDDVKLFEEQNRLIGDYIIDKCLAERKADYFNQFSSFKCIPTNRKPQRTCGAGINYLTFDYEGNIYPCHKFRWPIEKALMLGHIDKGLDADMIAMFEEKSLTNKCFGTSSCAECRNGNCKYCIAMNHEHNGDMNIGFNMYCEMSKLEDDLRWEYYGKLHEAGLLPQLDRDGNNSNNSSCNCNPSGGITEEQVSRMVESQVRSYVQPILDKLNEELLAFKESISEECNNLKSDIYIKYANICRLANINFETLFAALDILLPEESDINNSPVEVSPEEEN